MRFAGRAFGGRRRVALLERTAELRAIDDALAELGARGSSVYFEGTAGLGKSRLLESARERAERVGVRVMSAAGA